MWGTTIDKFHWVFWDGKPLKGREIGFDTETDYVRDEESKKDSIPRDIIPPIVLATASDGHDSVVIRPDQIPDFIGLHAGKDWVFFNIAFDFWVVFDSLPLKDRVAWWRLAHNGQFHDAMLLDVLIRLATPGSEENATIFRNLAIVAKEASGIVVDKEDPYRKRFAELRDQNWHTADPGFFSYAARDPWATVHTWRTLSDKARRIVTSEQGVHPKAVEKFGLLTETIQTKAAIALSAVTHNGIGLNLNDAASTEANLRAKVRENIDWLKDNYPDIFHVWPPTYKGQKGKPGEFVVGSNDLPSMDMKALQGRLWSIAEERGIDPPLSEKKQEITTSLSVWRDLAPDDDLVQHWADMKEVQKLLQFFAGFKGNRVRSRYTVLVRTGRTSASDPNIQQMPRGSWFRQMFTAPKGYTLITVDYSAIELVTLATICQARYGFSKLGNVIRAKTDPHAYTASMVLDVPLSDFMAWKEDPIRSEEFEKARQAAKAINFGVPGGLGASKLVSYAHNTYGVDLSLGDAESLRSKLITDIYPEIGQFLQEDTVGIVAGNLRCDRDELVEAFRLKERGDAGLIPVQRVVKGKAVKKDGSPYSVRYVDDVWLALENVAGRADEDLRHEIDRRNAGSRLFHRVFGKVVPTYTGRLRAGVGYTEWRNTQFQGLAADGAKLALFELTRLGHKIVAFVHDEIVVEAPTKTAEEVKAEVETVMIASMNQVLDNAVPVSVKGIINERWSK